MKRAHTKILAHVCGLPGAFCDWAPISRIDGLWLSAASPECRGSSLAGPRTLGGGLAGCSANWVMVACLL